jgi:hypothetical protein
MYMELGYLITQCRNIDLVGLVMVLEAAAQGHGLNGELLLILR